MLELREHVESNHGKQKNFFLLKVDMLIIAFFQRKMRTLWSW